MTRSPIDEAMIPKTGLTANFELALSLFEPDALGKDEFLEFLRVVKVAA